MNRRHFITAASLTSFSLGVLGSKAIVASSESPIDLLANPELLAILKDERAVLRIGRTYRERAKEEDDATLLRRKIEAAVQPDPFVSRESLRNAIRTDFEGGRTLQVNGWILSITEVRQCALYSLLYA